MMAIYEYQCTQCLKTHEVWQKISASPIKTCPYCSGPVQKLVSLSAFQLKGGGWYVDGYCGVTDKKVKKQDGTVIKERTGKEDSGTTPQ